jgi:hypothetical protein
MKCPWILQLVIDRIPLFKPQGKMKEYINTGGHKEEKKDTKGKRKKENVHHTHTHTHTHTRFLISVLYFISLNNTFYVHM